MPTIVVIDGCWGRAEDARLLNLSEEEFSSLLQNDSLLREIPPARRSPIPGFTSYTPRPIPPHRVGSEAVTLTWEGREYRIPADHPNYDQARLATYAMDWAKVASLSPEST